MTLKINSETGLPELPAPWVWWIGRDPQSRNSLHVAIVKVVNVSSENRADVYDPPPIHREPAVLEQGEPGFWPWSKAKRPSRWTQDYYFSFCSESVAIDDTRPALDSRVRAAAERVYFTFETHFETQAAADAIVGLYPPKSL